MAEDLVERLREANANSTQRIFGSDIFEAAADLIEQQAASLAAKDAEIERLTRARDDLRQLYQGCDHLRDQAERALAGAVEVMRPFAQFDHATTSNQPGTCIIARGRVPSVLTLDQFEAARAFVAQHGSDSREKK